MSIVKTLQVKIITPVKSLYDGQAESLQLTTTAGKIVVLPDHASLYTVLASAPLHIFTPEPDGIHLIIIAFGGIVKVEDNAVKILTDDALMSNKESLEEVMVAIKAAKEGVPTHHNISIEQLIEAEKHIRANVLK